MPIFTMLIASKVNPEGFDRWVEEAETLESAFDAARKGLLRIARTYHEDAKLYAPERLPEYELLADPQAYMDSFVILTSKVHFPESGAIDHSRFLDLDDVSADDFARLAGEAPDAALWAIKKRARRPWLSAASEAEPMETKVSGPGF